MKIIKNISYGENPCQKLDIYKPDEFNNALIIDIHGGGWWQGDKEKEHVMASKFADEGYLVVVPNYRLADGERSKNLYPTQVQDLNLALKWLDESGYRCDGEKIGIFGASSGGNLAAELCVSKGYPTTTWSALMDLENFYNTHLNLKPEKRIIDNNTPSSEIDQGGRDDAYYKWVIINFLGGDMSKLHNATVINRVNEETGPMFLVNSIDELVPGEEMFKMAETLLKHNQEVQTLLLKGNRHAEAYFEDAIDLTLNFFKKHLLD